MEPIPKELFEILACPKCKCNLNYDNDKVVLVCYKCNSKYSIKNGIPILITALDKKDL